MMDYVIARRHMVESQLRPNMISDARLIAAMTEIPRELFVPKRLRGVAYVDEDLEIAPRRYVLEPRVLGRLLQALAVRPDDVALVLGCGLGYASAVLARLATTVVALEPDANLAQQAGEALSAAGINNVVINVGSLAEGYPAQAPYDVILFDGAIDKVPEAVCRQLAESGRMVAVLRPPGAVGEATIWECHHGRLSSRSLFEAGVPLLPGFEPTQAFAF